MGAPRSGDMRRFTAGAARRVAAALAMTGAVLVSEGGPGAAQTAPRGEAQRPAPAPPAATTSGIDLLVRAIEIVRRRYVSEPDAASLVDNAIRGMLARLDPDADYFAPGDPRPQSAAAGRPADVTGLHLTREAAARGRPLGLRVTATDDGSPAAAAGIAAGDLVTHIDDEPVSPRLSLVEAGRRIGGAAGTALALTVLRRGSSDPLRVLLVRAGEVPPLKVVRTGDGLAVARIARLAPATRGALEAALARLAADGGGPVRGLVLDLRDGGSGTFDEAIAVADAFLDDGLIATTRSRRGEQTVRHSARPGSVLAGVPMAVLIDAGTQGPAEVLAGALKDAGRAHVVGVRSAGRAGASSEIALKGSGGGAIRIRTLQYLTPRGRVIDANGIEPDTAQAQAEAAVALPCRDRDVAETDGAGLCRPRSPGEDRQLQRALGHLSGRARAAAGTR